MFMEGYSILQMRLAGHEVGRRVKIAEDCYADVLPPS